MTELGGEKIDIVDYSEDPGSSSPRRCPRRGALGRPSSTPKLRAARVIVPDYQLSLAIGKEGQNARLAAKLTGWRIDIRPTPHHRGWRRRGRQHHAGGRRCSTCLRAPGRRLDWGTDRTGLRGGSPSRPGIRTCIGCRRTDSRSALLRVVAADTGVTAPAGVVVPDPRDRLPGAAHGCIRPRVPV
jgi:hypothetical protein